jgi:protein-S-isoprenylcysteine O-methyltransferase Ste14
MFLTGRTNPREIVIEGYLRGATLLSYVLIAFELIFLPIPSEASTRSLTAGSGVRPGRRARLLLSYGVIIVFYVFPLVWAIHPPVYRLAMPLSSQPAFGSPAIAAVSIAAIVLGSAIAFAGTVELRRAIVVGSGIVSSGIFRLSRNPIVLGLQIGAVGYLVCIPSPLMAVGLIVFLFHMHIRIRIEEAHLRSEYGETYSRYCRSVGRYVRWYRGHCPTIRASASGRFGPRATSSSGDGFSRARLPARGDGD